MSSPSSHLVLSARAVVFAYRTIIHLVLLFQ